MRLLFVVQRYGHEVAGGAERVCRDFATGLAARGHDVEVATTRAVSYVDWANSYPAGTTTIDGVTVHRLPVAAPRDNVLFAPLNLRVIWGHKPVAPHLQREWMRFQGPYAPQLLPWLAEHAGDFDVVAFFTYLYWTTWAGLPAAAGLAPVVLHPFAHDEPHLQLGLYDEMFRHAGGLAFLTEEEGRLVLQRFGLRRPSAVTGAGVDLDIKGDEAPFRAKHGLGDRPYLLFAGRVDPSKGSQELFDFFVAYKGRRPGPLALVVLGEPVHSLPRHDDVVITGFVSEQEKADAIRGCLAMVVPSYFESFSVVLVEAWAQSRPAIVQRRCDVLEGQARRSGGAFPYAGYAEFEATVDLLCDDPSVGGALGDAGRRYAERYRWDGVFERYERFLEYLTAASRA